MTCKQIKTRGAEVAIIILFLSTLFLGSCGQESSETATATTSSDNSSTSDEGTTVSTLSAPANLTATATTGTATLNWDSVSRAASYTLYWATSSGITSASSAIASISTANYTHSSLSNGSTYYYKVAAVDSAGTGTLSSEVSASPVLSVPANFSVTAGNTQTSLDWDAVSGAASYTLYWGNSSGITASSTAIPSISTDNYTHTSLTNDTVYYYKVAAVDASGTGGLSSEVSTTPAVATGSSPAPANLTVTASTGTATLDWDAVSGATSYTLYWATSNGISTSSSAIPSISTDNYTHSSLSNGSTYYYKVAAIDATGVGTLSSEVSASPVLTVPANFSATTTSTQTSLDWDAVSGASSYTLYWGTANGITSSSTAIASISTDNYTHTGLTNGTTYYYKVAAIDASSTGSLSSEVSATPVSPQMGGAIQGTVLSLTGNLTTYTSGFRSPKGITSDGTYLYLANGDAEEIKKIKIADKSESVLASFNDPPTMITTDGTNVYVSVDNKIYKILISNGVKSVIAGSTIGYLDNETGTSAKFNYARGVTTDGTNLYVADSNNHAIRQVIISTGKVTTIAGSAGNSGNVDNVTGTDARFYLPYGITTDGTNLYVTDHFNHTIRKIVISTGTVTTIAGSGSPGSSDLTGTAASFNKPSAITMDGTNLYVVENGGEKLRKIVISTGVVSTIVNSEYFEWTRGITTDGTDLYATDMKSGRNAIMKIE